MKLRKHAKTGNYPEINAGDQVRLPIVHKTPKGFKQQWSDELHTVQASYHNGVYKVNGDLYPRKELQLVKGNVVKLQPKTPAQQAVIDKQDKIGKAANHPAVKQLLGTKKPDYKTAETMLDSGTSKRITKGPADYAAYGGKNFRTKK